MNLLRFDFAQFETQKILGPGTVSSELFPKDDFFYLYCVYTLLDFLPSFFYVFTFRITLRLLCNYFCDTCCVVVFPIILVRRAVWCDGVRLSVNFCGLF